MRNFFPAIARSALFRPGLFLALLLSTPLLGVGQVSLTGSNPTYSQDFNALISTGTAAFVNNSTIPGVYSQRTGTGTNIAADAGGTTGGNLYSYGVALSTERALGALGSSNATAGSFAHGILFKNDTGSPITAVSVDYVGEQWRNSAAAAQKVTFWYQISASPITNLTPNVNTGWTAVTALDFDSPITGGSAGVLVGNLPANRVAKSSSVTLSVPANSYVMLRWDDPDHTGSDHGLAIDDVSLTFTNAGANTIALGTLAPAGPYCVTSGTGTALSVPFTSTGPDFTASSTYTAQLSDATGAFGSPVNLPNPQTGVAGPYTISTTIPAGTVSGTAYRVRVVSGVAPVTSVISDLSGALTIRLAATNYVVAVAGANPQTFATTSSGSNLTASVGSFSPTGASNAVAYQWKYGTAMGGPYTDIATATSAVYLPTGADFGGGVANTYYLVAEATTTCGGLVRTSAEVTITTTPPAPAATVRRGVTIYPSGGADYAFSPSVVWGSSSTAVSFTIENTGTGTLNLGAFTASSEFSATAPGSTSLAPGATTTFNVTFTPTGTGARTGSITIPSNDPGTPYILNLSGTGLPSNASDVVANGSFSYNNTGLDYAAYQSVAITNATNSPVAGAGIPIYSFAVRDGGAGADADNLPTILESITFSSGLGLANIRNAALFNGTSLISNVATINVGAGTIAFAGLVAQATSNGGVSRVTIADNGSSNITLRVTFLNTPAAITDGVQLRVSLTNANVVAAASGSSTFGTFTTVVSSTALNDNRVNAIATKLVFSPAPPVTAGVNSDFTVGVVAQDANNVADTDFRGGSMPSVTLTISGGTGALSSLTGLTAPLAAGAYTWTDVQYDVIEAGLTLSTTNTGSLTNPTAPMSFVAFAGKLWTGNAGDGLWSSANNWTPVGVPTAADEVWLSHSSISGAYTVTVSTAGAVAKTLRIGDDGSTITLLLSGTPSADLLTVGSASGFDLSITNGGVLNNTALPSAGVVRALAFATPASDTWQMTGNGTYQHRQTSGSSPNPALGNTSFAATSNFEVYAPMSNTFGGGSGNSIINRFRDFGNLLLSPSSGSTARLSNVLNNGDKLIVRGNMTMVNTGSFIINRSNTSATAGITLRVIGDLSIGTGSNLYAGEDNSTAGTGDSVVVRGNVSGTGQLAGATGSGTPSGVVQIGGNLTGVFYNASQPNDQLVFLGGAAAVADYNPNAGSILRKTRILKEVRLLRAMPSSGALNPITVGATGTLDFNGFNTTGTGPFTLVAGGTLKITDPDGITAAAATPTGNVRNTGARTFPNGATYWYTGTTAQQTGTGLPTTNGTKTIIADNPTTLTLTDPLPSYATGVEVRISAPGALDIRQGTVIETATAEIVGTGNLTMTGGAYRLVKGVAMGTPPALPQLSGTYSLTGGAVALAGAQNQSLKGGILYNKLRFKNAGTKTLTSAISNLPDSVVVGGAAILDLTVSSTGVVGSVGLTGVGGLQMSGTSRLRTTRTTATGPAPGMSGEYTLTGGTIEFAHSGMTIQTVRGNEVSDPDRTYFNVEVTGTNVGASSGNFAIGAGATMTVKPAASFTMVDQTISGAGTFLTEAGSTFGYGAPLGISASGATGNIQTATRTFNSAATYLLRGTAGMITGTGLPASVQNLTVTLGTVGAVATLTNATTVTGTLDLTQGLLGLADEDLTIPATATLTGVTAAKYIRTADSPTATGELVRPVPATATSVVFPVGTSTYTPVTLQQGVTATADDFRVRVFNGTLLEATSGTPVTADVVDRTWMVDETTPGGSDATLTLQWNAADETTGFVRTQCTVAHYVAGDWTHVVRDYLPATVVAPGVFARTRTGLTSFSPFAIEDYDQPLPVELTRFTATVTPQQTVALNWQTASEKNADRFEVQRAVDGRKFETIGTVKAFGTTSLPQEYRFVDGKPLAGLNYYRLRQLDVDGAESISPVLTVQLEGATTATLATYPQPFVQGLQLTLGVPTAGAASVEVLDLTGRRVLTYATPVAAGRTVLTVPGTEQLAPGAYVVRVALPGVPALRERIVKE